MTTPIGELLLGHRARLNMTQEALAELAALSGSLIVQVEKGRKNLGYASAQKVIAAFALSDAEAKQFMAAREATARRLTRKFSSAREVAALEGRVERLEFSTLILLRAAREHGIEIPDDLLSNDR